ncbi:MAG: hypothetical protein CBD16_00830 [Betaproteobacteria bacterium TMED156]|nr:MAG: hypothetical protein CBD16_00830 [Betaproteobacteria bacterium TMED156]
MSRITKIKNKWRFWIDIGGTFTDIITLNDFGRLTTFKVPSGNDTFRIDPVFDILRQAMGLNSTDILSYDLVEEIRVGTTIGTNALLQRKGSKTAFLVTNGFEDILRIGHQTRSSLFNLRIKDRPLLYKSCHGIEERIDRNGSVITPLNVVALEKELKYIKTLGINSLAIAFMNSYKNSNHEIFAKEIAKNLSFKHISVSHEVSKLIGFVDRCSTAVIDAYLSPVVNEYVSKLKKFTGNIPLRVMQSNGGLIKAMELRGNNSVLSGPAGGVVGAIETSRLLKRKKIICFDMGGTSTDVAHSSGKIEYRSRTEIEGLTIVTPMVDIHTVAAGGGSVVRIDGTGLRVGPNSAGSYPGPACYGRGGPLTITDCNLLLGFLNPDYFPNCFGEDNKQKINKEIVNNLFKKKVKSSYGRKLLKMNIYQVASGFIKIANEKMANAIKKISIDKGYDVRTYTLNCYGAAAGQHCCDVADLLGVKEILIGNNASVLSAFGIGVAGVKKVLEESVEEILTIKEIESLKKKFSVLEDKLINEMKLENPNNKNLNIKKLVNIKYLNTSEVILVHFSGFSEMKKDFFKKFKNQFGFIESTKELVINSLLVAATSGTETLSALPKSEIITSLNLQDCDSRRVFENGIWKTIPLINSLSISSSSEVKGSALILCGHTSVALKTGWKCSRNLSGDLILKRTAIKNNRLNNDTFFSNVIESTLFGNQLTAIAEQMGIVLKKTAASVNIKERNDFSCAIFDSDGNLLANAPHIPVHLGSMSDSVKSLVKSCKVKPGEVYLTNNPFNGGTHLPDITCISPVLANRDNEILFFVASRGHHADIGGKTPGSMPANSVSIQEEGVLIDNICVISEANFQEIKILNLFSKSLFPPRNSTQNIFDIKAQIAANQKGIEELVKTIQNCGIEKIKALSKKLLYQGEDLVKNAIKNQKGGSFSLELDNGIKIAASIDKDIKNNKFVFDFNNTDSQHPSNFNAPLAITKACVLYVLRCLIFDEDIPLNEGCLFPVEIKIPKNNLLNPSYPAAVVAGNVETSQKIVDCLLGAMRMQAGSQGTMNNLSFGNSNVQYYETICGGTGAGPNFNGTDATQSHMTNSRITDPEILEHNYPVRLQEFSIRKNCGGEGEFIGGNGVIRTILFLEPMTVSILSNCRTIPPHGLIGGGPGERGKNIFISADNIEIELDPSCQLDVEIGDSIKIHTPGGGGFGFRSAILKQ